MPYVSIKAFPGRSDEQKDKLAKKLIEDVADIFSCSPDVVTVTIEDVAREEWEEKVEKPEILAKQAYRYPKK